MNGAEVTIPLFERINQKLGERLPRCSKNVGYIKGAQCVKPAAYLVNGSPTCRQHASALALDLCVAAKGNAPKCR